MPPFTFHIAVTSFYIYIYLSHSLTHSHSHAASLTHSHTASLIGLYQLAMEKSFVFGRKQVHVASTCLYAICRKESKPHLLIDFSDALQVNVYVLGKSFLQFIRLLNLQLPIIDPGLYIHRYALRLPQCNEKLNSIIIIALRIVTRLKKDWIVIGRRPDGICAAALLIAARAHGYPISQGEIAKIFRISCDTIRRRLDDFRAIPSAQLTVFQFHTQDCAVEFDPPAYIKNLLTDTNAAITQAAANSMNIDNFDDNMTVLSSSSHSLQFNLTEGLEDDLLFKSVKVNDNERINSTPQQGSEETAAVSGNDDDNMTMMTVNSSSLQQTQQTVLKNTSFSFPFLTSTQILSSSSSSAHRNGNTTNNTSACSKKVKALNSSSGKSNTSSSSVLEVEDGCIIPPASTATRESVAHLVTQQQEITEIIQAHTTTVVVYLR